jgi:putative DNA primase/helicase
MDATSKRQKKIRLPQVTADLCDILHDSGRTDSANAERFIDTNAAGLLFVPEWGKWLTWDGRRWADDSGVGVMQRAKRHAKSLWSLLIDHAPSMDRDALGTLQSFIKATNQLGKILAFVKLAESDSRIVCPVSELNQHHTKLNVLNGAVDLESGELRKHDPADRMTQIANVRFDAAARCPEWEASLQLIFDGDNDLIRYVQQLLGYSCSGLTDHHILPICWGSGNNGKSTIWNVVEKLLGDYAKPASQDLLLPVQQQHPTIIADLYQRRFVPVAEIDQGRHLAEAIAKTLTGGDKLTARKCKQDFWDFEPTHKLWLSSNHKPKISGTDGGVWRRLKLIPFTVDIATKTTPKPGFASWLVQHEGPGILAWMVRGFRDYRQNGMAEPQCVTAATSEYRSAEDKLGVFLAEHCNVVEGAIVSAAELFEVYQREFGGKWSKTAFGSAMAERFTKERPTAGPFRNKCVYHGIALSSVGENRDFFEENQKCS